MNENTQSHRATVDFPINELLTNRWSPYSYSNEPVSNDDLRSVLEAARWAPSSYNEQPWYYLVATQDDPDEFAKLLSCLVEANQSWARHAPVLVLGVASGLFARNGKPNRHSYHDLGQATAHLTFEAADRGLSVHQMAGLHPSRAQRVFSLPEGFEAVTAFTIGFAGDNPELSGELKKREQSRRRRRPLSESVFGGSWGHTHPLLAS